MLKLLAFLFLTIAAEKTYGVNGSELILQNVNVITLADDQVLEGVDVRISDGYIVEIGREITIPEKNRVIDSTGLFVMPALFEMHSHIGSANPMVEYQLALFRYFGIHHIMLMTGDDELLELAGRFNRREVRLGPTISLASELIDGDPPLWGDMHDGPILTEPEQVEEALLRLKEKGYSDIKVYNRLNIAVYQTIIKTAEKLDMWVVGHVPDALPVEYRLNPRHRRLDHLQGYLELSYSGDLSELPNSFLERRWALLDGYDRERMKEAAHLTVERGIWNTPTYILYSNLTDSLHILEMTSGETARWVDPGLQEWWSGPMQNPDQLPHISSTQQRDIFKDMIGLLHEAGAKFLAGTDSPLPALLFGYALHKELHRFVEIGMSPFEALRTATVNPAEYLGMEEYGKALEGYRAELLLLRANPLENIRNTLEIEGIVTGNKYLSRSDMETILVELRKETEPALLELME